MGRSHKACGTQPPLSLVAGPCYSSGSFTSRFSSVFRMSARLANTPHTAYRPDIDGLRAVAVLSVVIYHAFPALLTGGFIGVDIFFVISGYLITLALMEQTQRGQFSLFDFYARRIKRIFPTLITILVACFAFGWLWLLADDFSTLGRHIAAGAAFASNLVLWGEAGYFDASAESKPLLHLWSLGIEEQFYILWPLLIWAAWKARIHFLWLTVVLVVASFVWNVESSQVDTTADFYSPFTRAWELLCGGFLAWWALRRARPDAASQPGLTDGTSRALAIEQALCTAGIVFLALGFLYIRDTVVFPGYWAFLPVMGSMCLIAAGPNAWFNRHVLSNPVAVWVGLISYPLYLWHWPLLSFSRMTYFKGLSNAYLIGIVLLSIALAWLTYRLIERPIRFKWRTSRVVPTLMVGMVVTGLAGLLVMKHEGVEAAVGRPDTKLSKNLELIGPNFGLDRSCVPDHAFNSEKCVHGNNPNLYLWGDSHSMHLAEALRAEDTSLSFRQQSMTACAPILDMSLLTPPRFTEAWGVKCLEHNQKVLDWLSSQKTYEYVVLASPFRLGPQLLTAEGLVKGNAEVYLAHLRRTVERLRQQGFKPIIIAPVPAPGYNMGRCWARMAVHNQESYCDFHYKDAAKATHETEALMEAASEFAPVLHLRDMICREGYCNTTLDGIPIYRDAGHLSAQGSRALGAKHHFARTVREQADRFWERTP